MGRVPTISGFSHVSITVTDLHRSEEWYSRVLGLVRVLDEDDGTGHRFVYLVDPATLIGVGLHVHDSNPGHRFTEIVTGLDHGSFSVVAREELDQWATRRDELGVAHSPVVDVSYGGVLVFRDLDNIQLEFIYIPPQVVESMQAAIAQS